MNDLVFFIGPLPLVSNEVEGVGRRLEGEIGVGGAATISSVSGGDESSLNSVRGDEAAEDTGDFDGRGVGGS